MTRGIMPHSASGASPEAVPIVCVFPEPVWPYANTVALYPANTARVSVACVRQAQLPSAPRERAEGVGPPREGSGESREGLLT